MVPAQGQTADHVSAVPIAVLEPSADEEAQEQQAQVEGEVSLSLPENFSLTGEARETCRAIFFSDLGPRGVPREHIESWSDRQLFIIGSSGFVPEHWLPDGFEEQSLSRYGDGPPELKDEPHLLGHAQLVALVRSLQREVEKLRRVADENYVELGEDMNESWDYSPGRRLEVDWPELHAKINSRVVHRPAKSLRERNAELVECLRAHRGDLCETDCPCYTLTQ